MTDRRQPAMSLAATLVAAGFVALATPHPAAATAPRAAGLPLACAALAEPAGVPGSSDPGATPMSSPPESSPAPVGSAAAAPEGADALVGTWCVVTVGTLDAAGIASIEFGADGEVTGFGGVNRFRGPYTVDGGTVEFGALAATMMAGPEPANSVEGALFGALIGAQPFSIEGSDLTIGESDAVVVLRRVEEEETSSDAAVVVSGTVTYLERMALPAGAVVTVRVSDVSIADAPAPIVAEAVITPTTQVPIPYAVAVPAASLEDGRQYSLSATITTGGDLLFTSTEMLPVATDVPAQTIDVLLSRA
jgi:uncharacterized lipoprotein YbaY